MRKETLKVQYRVPQGTELTRLTKKSAVSYIHIGRPTNVRYPAKALIFDGSCIQLNDKYVTPREIIDYISAEKSSLSPEDQQLMTVSIKADKETKMSVINEVKQALRQAKALKINYSAIETKH